MREWEERSLLEACRRLAKKGLFDSVVCSFSVRLGGELRLLFAGGCRDWARLRGEELRIDPPGAGAEALHRAIYGARADVAAVAIGAPLAAQLLAGERRALPPLFDEQVRQLGIAPAPVRLEGRAPARVLAPLLAGGANALLVDGQLIALGADSLRAAFHLELFDKCARAYLLARAVSGRVPRVPWWVRRMALHGLRREERAAAGAERRHGGEL
jgi:ribulose-5-phosphate 4-epimerase/fuculose-1-phosphate aldolase